MPWNWFFSWKPKICQNLPIYKNKDDYFGLFIGLRKENRKQKATIRSHSGDLLIILFDVPKGSSLGSLSFIIFLSDLSDICNVLDYDSYADDTTSYVFKQIYTKAAEVSERNINKIFAWLKHNGFLENSDSAYFLINPKEKISLKILHSVVKFKIFGPNFQKLIMLLLCKANLNFSASAKSTVFDCRWTKKYFNFIYYSAV